MRIVTDKNGLGFDFCSFLDYDRNSDVRLYEIGNYKCFPEYSFGPVIRPRGIIHHVTAGKGKLVMADREHHIHEGQIFFIPAGVRAYYIADKHDPWSYQWIHIGGSVFLETLNDAGLDENNPVKDVIEIDGHNVLAEIFADLFANYEKEFFCIGKTYELLEYFKAAYIKETNIAPENHQLKYVRTVIKFIQLKYSEPIKVDDIASACNLNRSYLSRLFHTATGSTIQDYIITFRMNTAENLLKNTDNTIQYVAYAVGYNDIYTFSKAFKKHIGITPSEYRSI